ncbi:Serpin 42Da [Carabus blaptoides fortunei]
MHINSLIVVVLEIIFGLITILSSAMADNVELVVNGNNKFGANFFNIAARNDGNLVISPFSAHIVLSMAYQGAGGKTAEELGNLLGVTDAESVANGYEDIISKLNQIKSVTLDVANKVYVMKNAALQTAFQNTLSTKYSSAADEVDFGDNVNSAKLINDWVEQKTHDKIHELIKPDMLNSLTKLVLVNAVYFKGNWAKKFDKERTTKKPFYLADNSETEVDMMYQKSKFRYGEDKDLDCKLLEMPYEGNEVSMLIILPNEMDGITKLQEKIKDVDVVNIMQNMYETTVEVSVPKFKIETTSPMKEMLKEMGAADMFGDEADFSKITEGGEPLKVSDVIQKAFIEVNEEGAEAAAATGMIMMTRCMPIRVMEKSFNADHPFLVKLVRKDAGNAFNLFLGRISLELSADSLPLPPQTFIAEHPYIVALLNNLAQTNQVLFLAQIDDPSAVL